MIMNRWRVAVTPAEVPGLVDVRPGWVSDWSSWLRTAEVAPGMPFLVSPRFEYDVRLNGFFRSPRMWSSSPRTQVGYARDLAAFLTFVWTARGVTRWDAVSDKDHLAYLYWRRHDPDGPLVAAATWNRELTGVNQFFRWAVWAGHVPTNPIPQQARRAAPVTAGWAGRSTLDEQRPATVARDTSAARVQWLPAASYRRWRDVGVRGFTAHGLPEPGFRGRWAGRNAVFCDLMIRTGLRLSEQAALTIVEVPRERDGAAYQPFWLPEAIAKGGSARTVYVPGSVVSDLVAYRDCDRVEVIERARAEGRYARIRRPLVVEDPYCRTPRATAVGGQRVKVASLTGEQRLRLLVETEEGLEPAAWWLGEHGLPLSVARWKKMFEEANDRCRAVSVALAVHPHMLRHSFAVITLEQLQRGHLAALGGLSDEQRGHYVRVFGDPLDWVRRLLGHRSVVSTQIYLHTLAELEAQTRRALVPDDWTAPPALADVNAVGSAQAIGGGAG
ncbi:tyrosine-type recombinase/integrase [Amycolatopsis sp. NPDC059021]|uniref:tyrosine-type recombinase/integrase n=1 Tax=Amycolatopsis sp. NPDC059021 TaxID=3346704 RepID=UPI003672B62B